MKTNAIEIRLYISRRWRVEVDASIAARFGVTRQYVMTARQRIGLRKSLSLIARVRKFGKKKRATSLVRAHRRMTPSERLERHESRVNKTAEQKAQVGRSIEEVMREYGGANTL